MNEDFLAYVWKFQYFDKTALACTNGQPIAILRTGLQNFNAGPDFLDASIRLADLTWAGAVELHVKASDWEKHQHVTDQKYDQVILHVVWENDRTVTRTNGSLLPVLELKDRVAPGLWQTYLELRQPKPTIPCEPFLPAIAAITKLTMVERTLLERLEQKALRLRRIYQHANHNWEETAYAALFSGFGFKINQSGFEKLAQALPYKILQKHRHQPLALEALLFGQAGFLTETFNDSYLQQLQREHQFLQHKYSLPGSLHPADWNFLRLRPANFPPVRLAQLAALVAAHPHWFSALLEQKTIKQFEAFFAATPSGYWQTHYMPNRAGKFKTGSLGKSSVHLLLINVVAPLLVAYARETDQPELVERALTLLEQLPPEKNSILSMYEALTFENRSAAQSQGLLQLNREYCLPVKCLHCAIGGRILKQPKAAR